MNLHELLSVLKEKEVVVNQDPEIKGVTYDPLRVKSGFLYTAINIYTQLDKIELPNGHPFVNNAIKAGSTAIVAQEDVPVPQNIAKVIVPDSRRALALISGKFYGYPSKSFKLIGITGTNGKTTTAHVIESILKQKHRTGLIGTLYYKINGQIYSSKDTTPEPPDLQEIFVQMKNQKCEYCVMEVSSHGIDFHRVDGLDYEVGIWTNLTQDHLDWHRTMENYRSTKLRWFSSIPEDKTAVINVDDPSSKYFVDVAKAKIVTYGIDNEADIKAKDISFTGQKTTFKLVTPDFYIDIDSKLRGKFNLYNMLAAASSAYALGIDSEEIKEGLESEIVVAGRFQSIDKGQNFSVIIDYAHTPDGLLKILNAAHSMNPRSIIIVFGCGGDRDRSKRPEMARVVEKFSDFFIITDDNPRTEEPLQIVDDITSGLKNKRGNYKIIHDRREAIGYAIDIAQPGDIVLIAGKGHESTQTLKDETIHFNDYEVASEILEEKVSK